MEDINNNPVFDQLKSMSFIPDLTANDCATIIAFHVKAIHNIENNNVLPLLDSEMDIDTSYPILSVHPQNNPNPGFIDENVPGTINIDYSYNDNVADQINNF